MERLMPTGAGGVLGRGFGLTCIVGLGGPRSRTSALILAVAFGLAPKCDSGGRPFEATSAPSATIFLSCLASHSTPLNRSRPQPNLHRSIRPRRATSRPSSATGSGGKRHHDHKDGDHRDGAPRQRQERVIHLLVTHVIVAPCCGVFELTVVVHRIPPGAIPLRI